MEIDSIRMQLLRIDRRKRTLEQQIRAIQQKKLAALPKQVGCHSIDSLILALIPLASAQMRSRLRAAGNGQSEIDGQLAETAVGKRARFAAELKEKIRLEIQAGQKSVAQLSREYGPSHPTIMAWKREWGLTRPRAKAT